MHFGETIERLGVIVPLIASTNGSSDPEFISDFQDATSHKLHRPGVAPTATGNVTFRHPLRRDMGAEAAAMHASDMTVSRHAPRPPTNFKSISNSLQQRSQGDASEAQPVSPEATQPTTRSNT
jgi:hypothetical protein